MTLSVKSHQPRQSWHSLLNKVFQGEDVINERNGKALAVLIPIDDYEKIRDDLDDLRAARRAESIYEAWKRNPEIAEPWKNARAEFVKDGLLDE
jgi:PHD/YefM family antitoxin component YafN of YafNO toxin-antitoxin module